jgi:hypothetical protein
MYRQVFNYLDIYFVKNRIISILQFRNMEVYIYITFIYLVYIFIHTNLEINCLLKYANKYNMLI